MLVSSIYSIPEPYFEDNRSNYELHMKMYLIPAIFPIFKFFNYCNYK